MRARLRGTELYYDVDGMQWAPVGDTLVSRIAVGCPNSIPNPFHPGDVNHCGGISWWSVGSGGRMGQVMGEDATEIAPAAKVCTADCTAQDHVNGLALVVGFPFPVPDPVRLQPRRFIDRFVRREPAQPVVGIR